MDLSPPPADPITLPVLDGPVVSRAITNIPYTVLPAATATATADSGPPTASQAFRFSRYDSGTTVVTLQLYVAPCAVACFMWQI